MPLSVLFTESDPPPPPLTSSKWYDLKTGQWSPCSCRICKELHLTMKSILQCPEKLWRNLSWRVLDINLAIANWAAVNCTIKFLLYLDTSSSGLAQERFWQCVLWRGNIYSDLPRRLRTDGALSEIAAAWFIPFLHDRGCNIDIYCFCSHPESWWFIHSVCNVLLWTKFICIDNEFLGFLQDIMHCINLSPVNKSCKSTSKVLKCTRNVLKMKEKGLLMLWHIQWL